MLFLRVIIIFFWLFMVQSINSQNLVPNPSFEEMIVCPNSDGQISRTQYWKNATSLSTCDYFNACDVTGTVGVPSNVNNNSSQVARTGVAYAGIICAKTYSGSNIREYLIIKLQDTTLKNIIYYITFYTNKSDNSKNDISTIGAYFSKSDTFTLTGFLMNAEAMIESPVCCTISDTVNWVKVQGSFTAQGGEQYMVIGNFRDDQHCGLVTNGFSDIAYYYIDDVCVSTNPADCGINVGIAETEKSKIAIYPNPSANKATITFSEAATMPAISIDFVAIDGKVVRTFSPPQQTDKIELDIADLAKGMYFVLLKSGSSIIGQDKLMKK